MLRRVSAPELVPAAPKHRNLLRRAAKNCGGIHARVAKAIWPEKTAENWAAAAGKKGSRIAELWLSEGPSDAGKVALLRLLI